MKQFQRVLINTVKVVDIMLTVIFALIAPLLFFSARWMFQTWNHLTMDELVFHLNSPLEGTNTDMIKEYLLKCLAPFGCYLFDCDNTFDYCEKEESFLCHGRLPVGWDDNSCVWNGYSDG